MNKRRELVLLCALLLVGVGQVGATTEPPRSPDQVPKAASGQLTRAGTDDPQPLFMIDAEHLRDALAAPADQVPAFGGAPARLGLLDAVRAALDFHPTVRDAASILLQREREVDVSRAGYLPQVRAGVNAGRQGERGSAQIVSLTATQVLYDFGKLERTVQSSEALAWREQASLLLTIDDIARSVSQAVVEVQRYQILLDIARSQVKAIDDVAQITRMRSKLGASTRLDPLQAQVRLEAAQASESLISTQLQLWRTSLRSAIGRELPAQVDADAPDVLALACQARAPEFARVPMIMTAEAERVAASAQAEFARARKLPTLSLNGGVNHAFQGDLSAGATRHSEGTLTVNLTAPLYQGGALDAQQRAAQHALDAARARVEAVRLTVHEEWRRAVDEAEGIQSRLALLATRERNVIDTRALYREQYLSLGTRSALDLLNAEQEIHQAAIDHQNALHDLRRVQVDCLSVAGQLRAQFGLDNTLVQGFGIQP